MAAHEPIGPIVQRLDKLTDAINEQGKQIAAIQTMITTEAQRCPFREAISRATNNGARIEKNEKDIDALGKDIYSVSGKMDRLVPIAGGSGGGAGALAAAVAMALAKLMGWM